MQHSNDVSEKYFMLPTESYNMSRHQIKRVTRKHPLFMTVCFNGINIYMYVRTYTRRTHNNQTLVTLSEFLFYCRRILLDLNYLHYY